VRPVSASASSHRTLMPALSMRLHYAPLIELPGGMLLKGATLVAIIPSEDALREGQGVGAAGSVGTCWISEAFEEPYRTAAKVLLKRSPYCLEMNSFWPPGIQFKRVIPFLQVKCHFEVLNMINGLNFCQDTERLLICSIILSKTNVVFC